MTVEQPNRESTNEEREHLIAAIERGLADLDTGQSHSHADVIAEMRQLFPPTKRNDAR